MNIGEFVDEALAIKTPENDVSKSPESFSRSTLTESQRLRMEGNKRKAIEKREALAKGQIVSDCLFFTLKKFDKFLP